MKANRRLYYVWHTMKRRCISPSAPQYRFYGDRGVKLCAKWYDFFAFQEWAMENGYKPDAKFGECTIDRIDNSRGYGPGNCRFVSLSEQRKNQRNCTCRPRDPFTGRFSKWSEDEKRALDNMRKGVV